MELGFASTKCASFDGDAASSFKDKSIKDLGIVPSSILLMKNTDHRQHTKHGFQR